MQDVARPSKTGQIFIPRQLRMVREYVLNALRHRAIFVAITASATFLIYVRTLAPGVLPGDSGELQFAAWNWTLTHPTGYPLYLMLGGVWQHLIPLGDPAYRLNLFSAFWAALTVGLSYRIFLRIARHRGAALIATLTLAVSATFWSQATQAEVYSLNTFLVALLMWLALKWEVRREFKYAAAWAFVFGLALAHHRSIILLIPGFAAFFADAIYLRAHHTQANSREALRQRQFPLPSREVALRDVVYLALVMLPLLLYLYIPLRAGDTSYAHLDVSPGNSITTFDNTARGWINFILGRSFENELTFNAASMDVLRHLPNQLMNEFNPIGLALGLIGFGALIVQRRWSLAALTFFGFGAVVLFNAAYHIGDISDFYTPAYFIYVLWIAAGLGSLLRYLTDHAHFRNSLIPATAILIVAAVLPLENFFSSFADRDRSFHTEWDERWKNILSNALPPNAILLSNDRDEMTPMWYLQLVEHRRPDALGLFPGVAPGEEYGNVMRLVDSVIDSGRPTYVIKPMPALALKYQLEAAPADLYRIAPTALPPPTFSSHAVVGNSLRVNGFSIVSGSATPGGLFTLAVYWQPRIPLARNYKTSLQLFDRAQIKLAQAEDHQPGGEDYPTSLWQPGEILQDRFTLKLSPNVRSGVYHLFVRVYDAESDEGLGELTEIGTLNVSE